MICKYRHGGTRNTTPISTPTNQPSNSPNSHQDQYFCTHSGLPCSLPRPFQYLPQVVSTTEIHPLGERSHLTPLSAPLSRTRPTYSGEILPQLVQALMPLPHAPP